MFRFTAFLLAALSAAFGADAQEFTVRTVQVPMRDGVKLAADLYLPSKAEKAPVLVVRTPYNKSGARGDAAYLAGRGYAVLAQDCRGRFDSGGRFYAFVNEGADGYDTIEWAAAQPWSNGQVGTFGASYLAWDQYFAAMLKPPHLVAMFALVGGARFYDEYGYPGGVPNLAWPVWILNSARSSRQAREHKDAADRIAAMLNTNPFEWLRLPAPERARIFEGFPEQARMYADFLAHPRFDDYWRQRGFDTAGHYAEMKDVPILFVTGWYDYFAEGVLGNFQALSRLQRTAKRLVVGPWPHATGGAACGDASFGDSAAVDQRALMADWFDHWLRGRRFTLVSEMPVRFFRMGGGDGARTNGKLAAGGQWLDALSWPPEGSALTRYYLQPEGGLAPAPPKQSGASTFRHDPSNPVPTRGGRYGSGGWSPNCAQDTRPLDERADILKFQTAPLSGPVEVTGKIKAVIRATSDAPSADFAAKLIDVYPDGYALILGDGIARAAMGKSPREVVIDIGSVSNLFAAGHRIRVDIAGSNFPRYEPNPSAGSHVVLHAPAHASYIELPVSRPRTMFGTTVKTEMVRMRDGVKLATDVYRPEAAGRYPVLVARSPYNKSGERRRAEFFARNGYVYIAQDVRGRYGSEGELEALVNEGRDGYDTIEWAAAQPWSNGRVGTTGASYLGMVQYAAAVERPPHLAAMYVAVAGSRFYQDSAYKGGVRSLGWPVWILDSAARDPHASAEMREKLNAMVRDSAAWLAQPAAERARIFDAFPAQKKMYKDYYAHASYDDYWKQNGFDAWSRFDRMKDVPALLLSGWYDGYCDATIANFVRLTEIQKSAKKLIMGPWSHGYGRAECGDAKFPPAAELDENALQLDWFDHWLKGEPFRVVRPAAVEYFHMGPGGGWLESNAWPPARIRPHRLYLREGNVLARAAPKSEQPYVYRYDPNSPVPTRGGRQGNVCVVNQDLKRADIITLATGPLEKDMDVTGRMHADLWVSTDAADTDLVVRLIDVAPDGYAAPIAEGQLRFEAKGDRPRQVSIDLGSTSNRFGKGHRLRLDITSSSFPKLEPNPRAARNTIWHDAAHPSLVELPVAGGAL